MCIEINRGVTTAKQKCYVPGVGEHQFSANSITNILSLCDIADKHRVTLDANKEKAFKVYFLKKIVKFKQSSNSSHRLFPSDVSSNKEHSAVEPNKGIDFANNTANNNLKYFLESMKK